MIRYFLAATFILISFHLRAQIEQEGGIDESKLYASTKQVNQFFKRFNGEEDQGGNRYYEKDKDFRDADLRKKYISILFDEDNGGISKTAKKQFINDVIDKKNPKFLDFHNEGWFAEVNAVFNRNGKEENVILFFKIEKQGLGYAWMLDKVSANYYKPMFKKDSGANRAFIHPMSHELDFMNLHKAFNNQQAMDYTSDNFSPDYLSLFLYDLAKKQLTFKTVKSVKFHFFQCEGWYFSITEFNRPGYNTGWLISDLTPITNQDVPALKAYIYDQK
ncbi:MAG TPA: hypothetical protein PKL31_11890 [Fulvivirga sp.]|nr:hypothetical protein [Fulvivirga sp.]